MRYKNILLMVLVIILTFTPLWLKRNAEFGGADDKAEQVIAQVQPDYEPWFSSLWEPPSSEVESLLFAAQAAIGAGFIGYCLGYARGRRQLVEKVDQATACSEITKG